MIEASFVDFRKYANKKLNIIKESKSSVYEDYIMKNFGKLQESVSKEDLYKIAEYNNLNCNDVIILKDALYNGIVYDYLIHNNIDVIGIDKNGKIIYISNFVDTNLQDAKLYESKKLNRGI